MYESSVYSFIFVMSVFASFVSLTIFIAAVRALAKTSEYAARGTMTVWNHVLHFVVFVAGGTILTTYVGYGGDYSAWPLSVVSSSIAYAGWVVIESIINVQRKK